MNDGGEVDGGGIPDAGIFATGLDTRPVNATCIHRLDGNVDRATEVVLLEQSQSADNHNGGDLKFGPDGFLYI
ncbi:MAG: hypothetical protein GY822_20890 [Deltaproteobacteria bacterium]|nr:hypothetical protein [Deltaproteobacteria bacterium]